MNQSTPAIAHRHVSAGQSPRTPSLRRTTDTAHFNTHVAAKPERTTPCHQNLGMSGQRRRHCGARSSGHTVFFKYIPNAAQALTHFHQSGMSADAVVAPPTFCAYAASTAMPTPHAPPRASATFLAFVSLAP